jgi:hypothetical protein
MKLSALEITSELRLTQPATGAESGETLDIRFGIDTGCTVSPEFYELILYNMLNGQVTGEDGAVTTGVKAVYYDASNVMLGESNVVKLDKVITETGTELVAMPTVTLTDSTVERFVTKVNIYYIANDADVEDAKMIYSSTVPQKTIFAEATGVGAGKGVAIPASGGSAKLTTNFKIYWK